MVSANFMRSQCDGKQLKSYERIALVERSPPSAFLLPPSGNKVQISLFFYREIRHRLPVGKNSLQGLAKCALSGHNGSLRSELMKFAKRCLQACNRMAVEIGRFTTLPLEILKLRQMLLFSLTTQRMRSTRVRLNLL